MTDKRNPSGYEALVHEALGPNATPLQLAETVAGMLVAVASILEDDDSIGSAKVVLRLATGVNAALVGMLRMAH